ncbi:MAG: peptide chain release factor N(5)-glutamine methyltransferase [Acidobacteria bacterium]|nr:peptide chain release factor N(5)-glutamine methyltransferase [Acidobacteriota bacterium]
MSKHKDNTKGAVGANDPNEARGMTDANGADDRDGAGGGGDPPTVAQALAAAAAVLRSGGIEDARREAGTLLADLLGCDRAYLFAHSDDPLPPGAHGRFRERVGRRAAGEPAQYVTGRQEFYRLDFEVTPAVLIPRPETELLVETALEILRGERAPHVCDVGTGSGCVVVSLLHERADALALALDISPDALAVAARNAARHGVSDRLELLASDCFDALAPPARKFSLVVSNPPYVAEADLDGLQREVRDHEPRVALTPGGDGLSVIRRLLLEAPRHLRPGGHFVFEIGFGQHEAVRGLVDPRAWTTLGIRPDLQGIPRAVVLRLND